jgi:hypothetical protein
LTFFLLLYKVVKKERCNAMRKKIGTVLDEELLLKAKQAAVLRRRSLSQVLEDALRLYLADSAKTKKKGIAQSTRGTMQISLDSLKGILEEGGVYEA